jgi:hypothetical protein
VHTYPEQGQILCVLKHFRKKNFENIDVLDSKYSYLNRKSIETIVFSDENCYIVVIITLTPVGMWI